MLVILWYSMDSELNLRVEFGFFGFDGCKCFGVAMAKLKSEEEEEEHESGLGSNVRI